MKKPFLIKKALYIKKMKIKGNVNKIRKKKVIG